MPANGKIRASEKTAAATGKVGVLRRDPMAMLPFCGYLMGDDFAHWLGIGRTGGAGDADPWGKMPRIFYVNRFRKSDENRWLWPGFGENIRALKWVFERCDGEAAAVDTPIGRVPDRNALDLAGLNLSGTDMDEPFGRKLPGELAAEIQTPEARLRKTP